MNYSKTILACAIIIALLLILTSTLIILDHYEIIVFPTEALVNLGIITVTSPLVFLCATFFQSKAATIEEKKETSKMFHLHYFLETANVAFFFQTSPPIGGLVCAPTFITFQVELTIFAAIFLTNCLLR